MTFHLSRPGLYFRSLLEVCLEPRRRPDLVAGTLDGVTPAELARELGRVSLLRPSLLRPVLHLRVTADPQDCIPDLGWSWIGEALAERLGYGYCPWIAIRHEEAGSDHLHLIGSSIRFDGTRVPRYHEPLRARQIVADLERELDLQRRPSAGRCLPGAPEGRRDR